MMEDWSPNTSVRYGFSRVDSFGNVVSIWNFGDWGQALNDTSDCEETSPGGEITELICPSSMPPVCSDQELPFSPGSERSVLKCPLSNELFAVDEPDAGGVANVIGNVYGAPDINDDLPALEQCVWTNTETHDVMPALEPDCLEINEGNVGAQWRALDSGRLALVFTAIVCTVVRIQGTPIDETGMDLIGHIFLHCFVVSK